MLAALRLIGLPYSALTLRLTGKKDTSGFSRDHQPDNGESRLKPLLPPFPAYMPADRLAMQQPYLRVTPVVRMLEVRRSMRMVMAI